MVEFITETQRERNVMNLSFTYSDSDYSFLLCVSASLRLCVKA